MWLTVCGCCCHCSAVVTHFTPDKLGDKVTILETTVPTYRYCTILEIRFIDQCDLKFGEQIDGDSNLDNGY